MKGLIKMEIHAKPIAVEQETQRLRLPAKVYDMGGVFASLNQIYKSKLSNLRLKKKLTRMLANSVISNRHRISVEVNDGIVKIVGLVNTPGEKQIIGNLVSMTAGGRKVFNRIQVYSSVLKNDTQIVGAILYDLSSYLGLDLSRISVEVKNGTAYLRGYVPTIYMKCAAEELVCGMPQIKHTVNELKITVQKQNFTVYVHH